MIALNKDCYICEYMKSDFALATDYCERGNDDIMYNENCNCGLFKIDQNKVSGFMGDK